MDGKFSQALELLIRAGKSESAAYGCRAAAATQNMGAGMEVGMGAPADLGRERSAPPAPAVINPEEGLGLQTSTESLEPSATSSSITNRRRTRISLFSTLTAPSNPPATASNSYSSNSSQSKRASVARALAANPNSTPFCLDRAARAAFPTAPWSPAISAHPSFKARISTSKLGTPFKISLSAGLGGGGGEGPSTRGSRTPVEEAPPP
ncbi:hypothetical protein FRC01_007281, partial [Tulasnella sp. 417]